MTRHLPNQNLPNQHLPGKKQTPDSQASESKASESQASESATSRTLDPSPSTLRAARSSVCDQRSAPQRAWVCGYAELGHCCVPGPTARGLCCRTAGKPDVTDTDRRPAALDHSQIECNRATIVQGVRTASDSAIGKGTPGLESLPPCIPRRAGSYRRQAIRLNFAILTGGLLLLLMTLPSREQVFVPGELSSKHAQILDNTLVAQRCGLCHTDVHAGGGNPALTLAALSRLDSQQDALCMQCHQQHVSMDFAQSPHNLPIDRLYADTDPARSSHLGNGAAATRCATCHTEHHGRHVDIKQIADDRCQACHRSKFQSLSAGHPEFVQFPTPRPRALSFSHQSHSDKHFPQKSRDFDCRRCHLAAMPNAISDPISRSVSFEQACAECHTEPIRAATMEGWALLQLPSIDSSSAGPTSGLMQWPQNARFGYEGTITPVHRALLESDPAATLALEQLPSSGRLVDVPELHSTRQVVTIALALATQRLIADTANLGQAAWKNRLELTMQRRLGRALDTRERGLVAAMCHGLPPDLFRQMQSNWFHPAAANSTAPSRGAAEPLDALLTAPMPTESDGLLLEATSISDDKLLVDDDSLLSDDLLSSADLTPGHDLLLPSLSSASSAPQPQSKLKGPQHLSAGGWYLDSTTLSIRYMPTGHGDTTMAAWHTWYELIESKRTHGASVSTASFSTASFSNSLPGGCIDCHRIDVVQNRSPYTASFEGNWRTPKRSGHVKEFTKFNHAPHLLLPAAQDCRQCHALAKGSPSTVSSTELQSAEPQSIGMVKLKPRTQIDHDQSNALSDFRSMSLVQCVACHRPSGANSGCLQCHNYHITPAEVTAVNGLPATLEQARIR